MEIIEESIFPEQEVVYSGFWRRFAAGFIDGLVLLIPNLIIDHFIGKVVTGHTATVVEVIVNYLTNWPYWALMESGQNQATIGKQAMGIIVTDVKGGRLTFSAASARYWSKIISFVILLIGYLMMLWDDRKQTLHDKIAGAVVIKK